MTVSAFGMYLHAATTVDGRDRRRLERVCRYLLRPPFAHDAVEALADGRVRVRFKAPSPGGVAFAEMDVDTFLARLYALVPPPRFHMIRYYGLFSSHHRLRARIIPEPAAGPAVEQLVLGFGAGVEGTPLRGTSPESTARPRRRLGWAKLLARIFGIDVTTCLKCGGRMKVLEVVSGADALARVLHGARAPPRESPRGQLKMVFA